MSLNGLDAPQLQQIFESACAEPGSWFLLQYASRDEVQLLAKGTNGAQEMRETIAKEPQDSPLYGFIRYRRRNILIKYVPDATSRVVKARSQVHFQLVGERFAPHDVTFSMSASADLTESALTSACSTHSASASISSSSSSLRNRRLADIAESVEETPSPEVPHTGNAELLANDRTATGPKVVITTDEQTAVVVQPASKTDTRQGALLTVVAVGTSGGHHHLSAGPIEPQRRGSASSDTRPPIADLYGSLYTPKVKLGPRLSADTLKRPHTANSNTSSLGGSVEDLRPVATVPKSVHVPHRRPKARANSLTADSTGTAAANTNGNTGANVSVSESQSESQSVSMTSPVAVSPPPQPISLPVEAFPLEPVLTPELVAKTAIPAPPSGPPVLSPEKLRLMRALQLRKNTMKHEGENAPEHNTASEPAVQSTESMESAEKKVDVPEQQQRDDSTQQAADKAGSEELENAKVRGSDHENDSDASSVMSVEIAIAQHRPVSTLLPRGSVSTLSTTAPSQLSQRPPTSQETKRPTTSQKNQPSPSPIVLTKRTQKDQKDQGSTQEDTFVETARSVSAPFLNNARRERVSVAVPRTVNVSSGSVLSRIKQLEMLNKNAPPPVAAQPVRSHTVRVTPLSPSQAFGSRKMSPISKSPASFPLERTLSSPSPGSTSRPSISLKSNSRPDLRCETKNPLEVTTKIPRNKDVPDTSTAPTIDTFAPKSTLVPQTQPEPAPAAELTIPQPVPLPGIAGTTSLPSGSPAMPSLKDLESSTPMASNRRSLDMSSMFSGKQKHADNGTSVKEKLSFREKASAVLHKLNIDIESLPPLPMSPISSPREGSPDSPVTSSGKPKSIFGRDKDKNERKLEKKLEKEKQEKERQEKERQDRERRENQEKRNKETRSSRSRSPKPKKSLLRRMSSLTRKAREPTPPVQAPAEPPPKINLLIGWVNVQLPDTMLWRRKCIKIDSTGWLFLSVTEDETAPGTRRYHIPTDVRTAKIPDPDEQELPFSVQLDLYEGGTLQCACQNTVEQKEVLAIIQEFFS